MRVCPAYSFLPTLIKLAHPHLCTAVTNPWQTLHGIGSSVVHPVRTIKSVGRNIKESFQNDPYHASGATIANVGMAFVPLNLGFKAGQRAAPARAGAALVDDAAAASAAAKSAKEVVVPIKAVDEIAIAQNAAQSAKLQVAKAAKDLDVATKAATKADAAVAKATADAAKAAKTAPVVEAGQVAGATVDNVVPLVSEDLTNAAVAAKAKLEAATLAHTNAQAAAKLATAVQKEQMLAVNTKNANYLYQDEAVKAQNKVVVLKEQRANAQDKLVDEATKAAATKEVAALEKKIKAAELQAAAKLKVANAAENVEVQARAVLKAKEAVATAGAEVPKKLSDDLATAQEELVKAQVAFKAAEGKGLLPRVSGGVATGFDKVVGAHVNAAGWTASKAKAVAQVPFRYAKGTWVGQKTGAGLNRIKAAAVNNPRTAGVLGSAGVIGLSNQGANPDPFTASDEFSEDQIYEVITEPRGNGMSGTEGETQ